MDNAKLNRHRTSLAIVTFIIALSVAWANLQERSGHKEVLLDSVFKQREVVTVEAAGARCAIPADFDGDGDMDLASVSSNDNTVAWYERLADGSYGPKKMISRASNGARIVTTGDIDQDGFVDVIVASYYDHTVGWFKNDGTGKFSNMQMISRTANSAQGVHVADLDNDGDLDVLSASSGDHTIAWYENLGGGRFCEVKNIVDTDAQGIRTVVAADLDRDGFLDLAAAAKDHGTIAWYRNDGNLGFTKTVIDPDATGAYSLVAVDVDNDGFLDLVTAANMEGRSEDTDMKGGKVSFLRNSRDNPGTFTKIKVTGDGDFDWFTLSVWAGDLDKDGDVDVASASFGLTHQGGFSWYENLDGNGSTWSRHKMYTSPTVKTGHYIFGHDMDGDGDTDLVGVTNGDNKIHIFTATTDCDASPEVPMQSCCSSHQVWNATHCESCPSGKFVQGSSCEDCPTACPRNGLAWVPHACHSLPGCGDASLDIVGCDCGQHQFLDEDSGTCANCPNGQVTSELRQRTLADFAMVQNSFLDGTSYSIANLTTWLGFRGDRCEIPMCEPGSFFNSSGKVCSICQAGRFSSGGAITNCLPCPAGAACAANASAPEPCQAGGYSEPGALACADCKAGTISRSMGSTDCELCSFGFFTNRSGSSSCDRCALGSYASIEGQSFCDTCPEGLITEYAAATDSSDCVCKQDFFRTRDVHCEPCRVGMTCDVGSDSAGFKRADVKAPKLKPGFWSTKSDPLSVFKCESSFRCPGGPPESCGEHMDAASCAHCDEDHYFDGYKCAQCWEGGWAIFLFPIVPSLLIPIIIVFLYWKSGDSYASWGSWKNALASLAFIILNHYQVTALIKETSDSFPPGLSKTLGVMSWSSDLTTMLRPECAGLASFQHKMVMKALLPLIVLILYILVWGASQFFKESSMEPNRTMNGFFGMMFTFYAGIVSMALTLFKCRPNPNGTDSLVADRSILCYESTWQGMLAVGISATILWCVGFVAYMSYGVYTIPSMFHNPNHQMRWKFLLIKFRPDAYWWGLMFIIKGTLLNIGLVGIFRYGVEEIYWLSIVIIIYVCSVAIVRPWRQIVLNVVDVWAHMCLILLCSTCAALALEDVTADHDNIRKNLSDFSIRIAFTVLPLSVPMAAVQFLSQAHTIRWLGIAHHQGIYESFAEFARAPHTEFEAFWKGLGEWDMYNLSEVKRVLDIEYIGNKSRSRVSAVHEHSSHQIMRLSRVNTTSSISSTDDSAATSDRSELPDLLTQHRRQEDELETAESHKVEFAI